MQFNFKVNDAHLRFITGIGYNPFKHEIVTGDEEGLVKFWELDTGILISSCQAHRGWVTSFIFWKAARLMLSSSHDCTISLWQGNSVLQTIYFEEPLYKICFDSIEYLLLCGSSNGLHFYTLDKTKSCGSYIDINSRTDMKEHSGIVRCIFSCDNRVFSAGFDRKLVIYECIYYGSEYLKGAVVVRAHEAAISCMCLHKDLDNNIWIITGGFDKVVKVWNNAGKLVHRIDGFSSAIVDICSFDRTKQMWVSTGNTVPMIFDIKSGEDLSQFSNNFQKIEDERFRVQQIKHFPEVGTVVGTTSRRHLLSWRSQISSATTRLMCGVPIDTICLSNKAPVLIFCGILNGQILQWEKKESNEASYQLELSKLGRSMKVALDKKLQSRQFQMDKTYSKDRDQQNLDAKRNKTGKKFLQMIYEEDKDLLIAAAEDGIIYIFGYDITAIESLMAVTKSKHVSIHETQKSESVKSFQTDNISNKPKSAKTSQVNPSTMRITGLLCQHVLIEHKNVVSGIAVVPPGHGRSHYFMLSGSWDQRICLWSLESFELAAKFQNHQTLDRDSREMAASDVITSIAYCALHDQFAYSSADFLVHIRKFALNGAQMTQVTKIDFHDCEISALHWIEEIQSWVTASEDHLIKLWNYNETLICTQVINAGGIVSDVCYEDTNQILIASVGKDIKLFDIVEERMVQVNCGHTDDVKNVIILPGKHQFASAGEDGQLLIWNSWLRPKKYSGTRFNET